MNKFKSSDGEEGFNLNVTGLNSTAKFNTSENRYVCFQVLCDGQNDTHIVSLFSSTNGEAWVLIPNSGITGAGLKDNFQVTAKYVKAKVTKADADAEPVDIIIQAL